LQPTDKAYRISDPKAAGLETGLLANFEKCVRVKFFEKDSTVYRASVNVYPVQCFWLSIALGTFLIQLGNMKYSIGVKFFEENKHSKFVQRKSLNTFSEI